MQEYMRRMHERRAVEKAAVKERELRRRRLLAEVDAAADAEETAGRISTVVAGLQRESAEEARIAARLRQLALEEDVLVSNRNQRMAQYTERREKDWAEAIAREVELSQALKVPPQTGPRSCSSFEGSLTILSWHIRLGVSRAGPRRLYALSRRPPRMALPSIPPDAVVWEAVG